MTLKIWIVFFSGMTPCSLVKGLQIFQRNLLPPASKQKAEAASKETMEAAVYTKMLIIIYQTKLRYHRRPHYKANSHRAGKEIPPHFTEHITLLLCSQWPTTGQHLEPDNSVHTLTNCFSKTQLNIILGLSSHPFHSGFITIILYAVFISPTPI